MVYGSLEAAPLGVFTHIKARARIRSRKIKLQSWFLAQQASSTSGPRQLYGTDIRPLYVLKHAVAMLLPVNGRGGEFLH